MTLLEALHVYLSSKSAVTDLVSTRIYRHGRRQSTATLPAITYRKISGSDALYQAGVSTLGEARIEIECWASTPSGAEALKDVVRDQLQGYDGTITSGEESVVIVRAHFESDAEFHDPPQDKSGDGTYLASIDLFVWWRPTAPSR